MQSLVELNAWSNFIFSNWFDAFMPMISHFSIQEKTGIKQSETSMHFLIGLGWCKSQTNCLFSRNRRQAEERRYDYVNPNTASTSATDAQ